MLSVKKVHCAECHYAERRYTECLGAPLRCKKSIIAQNKLYLLLKIPFVKHMNIVTIYSWNKLQIIYIG